MLVSGWKEARNVQTLRAFCWGLLFAAGWMDA
jgi:hypothetical protein